MALLLEKVIPCRMRTKVYNYVPDIIRSFIKA